MSDTISPAEMTPDERLQEVAEILAKGVLRLHMRRAEIPAENRQKTLDSGWERRSHMDLDREARAPL